MKKLLEGNSEAQALAIVPGFASRLGGTARSGLPLVATQDEKNSLLTSISGALLQEFDAPDMVPQVEVTRCHDGDHPDTVFVAFMRDSKENDQKFRHLCYWPDGRPYALMFSDGDRADCEENR